MEIFPGISTDPGVRNGRPCIAGTRVEVSTIVGALADGESCDELEEAYDLTREQIAAALRFAAHTASKAP
jgi:uncharacterized protein (DUF433 family)